VDQGYRITRLTYSRPGAIIEVLHRGDGWTMHVTEFSPAATARIAVTKVSRQDVSASEAEALAMLFDATNFWRAGLVDPFFGSNASSTIEGRRASSYYVVFVSRATLSALQVKLFQMAHLDLE